MTGRKRSSNLDLGTWLQGPSLSSQQLLPQVSYRTSQPSISFCICPSNQTFWPWQFKVSFQAMGRYELFYWGPYPGAITCSKCPAIVLVFQHIAASYYQFINLTDLLNFCHLTVFFSWRFFFHPTSMGCHPLLFNHLGNLTFSYHLNYRVISGRRYGRKRASGNFHALA